MNSNRFRADADPRIGGHAAGTALIWARKKVEAGIHLDFQTMKGAMYSRDGEGKFLRAAESL